MTADTMHATPATGREGVVRHKRKDGSYYFLFRCEDYFGPTTPAVLISDEEAMELVLKYKESLHEEMFGERL